MKKLFGLMIATVLFFTFSASARADVAGDAEKLVGLMEKLAGVFDANKADCDKLAAGVDTFMGANLTEMKALRERTNKASEAEKKVLTDKYGARIMAASKSMQETGTKCKDNAKMQEVQKKYN